MRSLALALLTVALVSLLASVVCAQPATVGPQPSHWRHDWPIQPSPVVTREFERPPHRYGPGHRGVDLLAQLGGAVHASQEGIVAFAGAVGGRGVVSIDHASGIRTTYEPVEAVVRQGQFVYKGMTIGVIAGSHAGCSAPACLHWGARRGKEYLDPRLLVGAVRIVLKPLHDESHTATATAALTRADALAHERHGAALSKRAYTAGLSPSSRDPKVPAPLAGPHLLRGGA